ncbi:MAG: transposon-transfer assisting family protein [Oscillospiraceae bacterium]|jgi:hypothetical protein|nr:transposon-transfer assisting family protein [Oscillospiraceae bacterium]
MNERFTIEEINLMCIFLTPSNKFGGDGDTSSRADLISDLSAAIGDFDTGDPQSDAELREIAANTLVKLGGMSDVDFAALEFYPEYSDTDYYETEG